MFHNNEKLRAVVSPDNVRAREHGPILHEDETLVNIPCFFDRVAKRIRESGSMNYVYLDAEVYFKETDEVSRLIQRGALLRFEKRKTEYYKVFDIDYDDGVFGGAGGRMDVRLMKYKDAVRPTHRRTDIEDEEIVIVETDIEERDPNDRETVDNFSRWGR